MQPCSREMQAMNSVLNSSTTQQIPLHDLQISNNVHQMIHNNHPHFDPTNSSSSSSHHDFLQQMLLSNSWSDSDVITTPNYDETCPPHNPENNNINIGFHYDDLLPSKLRVHHQINATADGGGGGGGGGLTMPNNQGGEGSMQGLFNGFGAGSLHGIETNHSLNQSTQQHFNQAGGGNIGTTPAGTVMNRVQASGSTPAQPKTRVRARRGQATDPHSIAERLRRERIAERMKALQELVPNANRTDKASMLDEIIDYLKFLQLQVKVLSVSRLGGAGAAVAPFVANMPSQRGVGDSVQTNADGGSPNGKQMPPTKDGQTVAEHQVVKLMEEDMGSAMQYLQGKGLCLMPISLATAISTSTCHSRNPHTLNVQSSGEGPSSPSMSVLTVQSASNGSSKKTALSF